MDRRDFLNPRHVAHAGGQLLAASNEVLEATSRPDGPEEIALLRLGWRAMATTFEILLPFETPEGVEAAQSAFDLLDCLEDQLTVYRELSEVSQLNRWASRRPVRVETGLFNLLSLAKQLSDETDGAFDITTGRLIKAWGFFKGPRRIPSDDERQDALSRVGMTHVQLQQSTRTVTYQCQGLEINLGSIGKGYALDHMREHLLRNCRVSAALLHGGSSSVVGYGDPHGSNQGWKVRIRHPWQDRPLAEIQLRDRALGTSAATFQYQEHEGKKLGHILDPRTGRPASGMASVSVIAPTGATADALSTAFYVGGLDLARRYCERHSEIGAILLSEESEEPVVIGLRSSDYTISSPK